MKSYKKARPHIMSLVGFAILWSSIGFLSAFTFIIGFYIAWIVASSNIHKDLKGG